MAASAILGLVLGVAAGDPGGADSHPPWRDARGFGNALAALGDVDGDGSGDLAVGAPRTADGAGAVYGISGATGAPLWVVEGAPGSLTGEALAWAGDIGGDGRADLAAAARGRVSLHDARSGLRIATFAAPDEERVPWVAAVGDVDGDGREDLAFGGREFRVVGGSDGLVLLEGTCCDDVRTPVAPAGDVDGDGRGDLLATFDPLVLGSRTVVLSGRDGEVMRAYAPDEEAGNLVFPPAVLPDLDGDGFVEHVLGHPRRLGRDSGRHAPPEGVVFDDELAGTAAWVYSGRTGRLLLEVRFRGVDVDWVGAKDLPPFFTGRAARLATAGDLDRDGRGDLLVACPSDSFSGLDSFVWAFSGRDGAFLHRWSAPADRTGFGWSVEGLGDVDGDGHDDVALTDGSSRVPHPGSVALLSGRTGAVVRRLDPGPLDRD